MNTSKEIADEVIESIKDSEGIKSIKVSEGSEGSPVATGVNLVDKNGLNMINESSLSEDQKKLAISIYDSVKKTIGSFIRDPSINSTIKITKTIGQIIKQLESTIIDGKMITGADKKVVAIGLGRILIMELMSDSKAETEILMMYDIIAEPTLEAMIDVSKVVNIAVKKIATKCCPGLFELFKSV